MKPRTAVQRRLPKPDRPRAQAVDETGREFLHSRVMLSPVMWRGLAVSLTVGAIGILAIAAISDASQWLRMGTMLLGGAMLWLAFGLVVAEARE